MDHGVRQVSASADAPLRRAGTLLTEVLRGGETVNVFVHSVSSLPHSKMLAPRLPGMELYAERALLLARPQDVVCVLRPPEQAYLDYLHGLGLGPDPANVVAVRPAGARGAGDLLSELLTQGRLLEAVARCAAQGKPVRVNPFVASAKEHALARALARALGQPVGVLGSPARTTLRLYHKHIVRKAALELGIPVAPGEVVRLRRSRDGTLNLAALRSAAARQMAKAGGAIIRGSCGTSGSATAIVRPDALDSALESLVGQWDETVYLVDPLLDGIASPNVQVHVAPESRRAQCVSAADQQLDAALVHQGNAWPSRAETLPQMLESARHLGDWLGAQGYAGLAGMDFLEHHDPATGRLQHVFCEVNPRVNGATYPKALTELLGRGRPIGAFLSLNVATGARCFSELADRCGDAFFDVSTGRGLFPYNTGCLEHGKFAAAFLADSREQAEDLCRNFTDRLAAQEQSRP